MKKIIDEMNDFFWGIFFSGVTILWVYLRLSKTRKKESLAEKTIAITGIFIGILLAASFFISSFQK